MCGPLFYAATVVFGSPILPAASNQNTKVNMRKSYFLQALLFLGLAVSSCKTSEKVVYLQDVKLDMPERLQESTGITIQPKDMLSIVISCKDPELAAMFNLPVISYQAGSEVVAGAGSQRLMGYVVDEQGNMGFDPEQLQLSSGETAAPDVSASVDREAGVVVFTQQAQPLRPSMPDDDRVFGAVLPLDGKDFVKVFPLLLRGESGTTEIALPEGMKGARLAVYAFTMGANGKKAGQTVILMDSSKCGKILPYTFGNVEDVDFIISDGKLPEELILRAQKAGTKIL